ncbi:hypothetical protein [Zunongwangia profunda]|jgi:hypothetical protein|uniref:hypothetical protein n=1 Tax=Zunongwangia profunda TaxID=398743 RepID=UPI001D18AF25|nr:hypothetical protein [Zunongwangia profunda]MCC4230975.1 hypothetical protein [Zunongwangia profunda]|tara:strand:- start:3045 stop:3938 length:894 start_codon:yes stop_codon:yes gene_type:complete
MIKVRIERILVIILICCSNFVNAQVNDTGNNVGIGVSNPSEKLDVAGNVKATSFLGEWNGTNISDVLFKGSDSKDWDNNLYRNGIYRKWGSTNNPFGTPHATLLHLGQNDGYSFGFQFASDNYKQLKYRGFRSNGQYYEWYDIYHSGNFNKTMLDKNVPNLVYKNLNNNFSSDQSINGTVNITESLGIGTPGSDSWKLAVNGKIKAKEIKVETGWADFVFYDTYMLPSLEEVEDHIKKNGHLKNIPSADEVEKNGILLGEMNAKLLQKIEELTLYLIQQNKEMKVLKERIKTLENQD